MTNEERLAKAKAKSLSHHFSKAAAHHSAKADAHEKLTEAHKAHADHYVEMGKAAETDGSKANYKAAAAFHKSKATHHDKVHKAHKAYAAHNESMASAHDEKDDAEKVYKALGIEEETLPTNDPTPVVKTTTADPAPKVDPTPNPTPAAPAGSISENFAEYIQKALDKKLGESVDGAFERLLNSEDFSKRVDQEVAKKMLEKLGATTIDTPVKTFAIPRPGESAGYGKSEATSYEGIDETLLDLVKSAE